MRPTIQILEPDQIAAVLAEAKRIMAETGMEIRGAKMRQRLIDAGLPADATGRVLFPTAVVDRAIATAPKSFTLYNRDGEPHAQIGGWNVHFIPGSSGLKIMDHRTGETRLADSTDFVEYARLCDGLPHIPYLATAFSTNADIEPQVSDVWRLYMVLTNTKKPVVSGAFGEHGVPRMAELMQLFRRDRAELIAKPMSIFTITATGNFRFGEDSCQNLLDCVEAGIPVEIVPVTLMGLIAPVTLMGALVFHCVDVLTGITMAQVIKPGAPVLFGGAPATFHMRAASAPMAAIEAQRLNVGYVAIAKSLGLPTQAYMALSDGKFLDAQAGAETMSSALLAALAGVNSVSGPGMLDFVLTFSLAKLLFDNEVCGQCLNFVRETKVLEDVPCGNLVAEVRANDHLITSPHTLKYWPQELYLTDPVIDRENRETWIKQGSRDLQSRAVEQIEKRLAAWVEIPTEAAVDAEMRRIVMSGLKDQKQLPVLPPPPDHALADAPLQRRRAGRRPR
jgi:trimethylamine--corrinoid protein Co-methyltransferase